MIVILLLHCLLLIALDNCEKFINNSESNNVLHLRNMINRHRQLKSQNNRIINNIFLLPMPILIADMNYNTKSGKEQTVGRRNFDTSSEKQYPVFRDLNEIRAHPKKQNVNRKNNDRKNNFNPLTHKNWHLLPRTCGVSSTSDRITGGENAALGQYPWMARIGFKNIYKNNSVPVFRCGATLITKSHVITAAHCVTDLPPELKVYVIRLGEYNTATDVDCVDNRCADKPVDFKSFVITVHENYGLPIARNDIAIVSFKNSVSFTEWVTPICLPSMLNEDLTNQKGEVAGWGFYDISINRGSTILQTVHLPILSTKPCNKAFRGVVINNKKQLCVGGDLGKDSCNGDSGGPLMKVIGSNKEPKYVLLGIVSLGAKYCGLTTAPAVYTKVSYYMEWILNNLK